MSADLSILDKIIQNHPTPAGYCQLSDPLDLSLDHIPENIKIPFVLKNKHLTACPLNHITGINDMVKLDQQFFSSLQDGLMTLNFNCQGYEIMISGHFNDHQLLGFILKTVSERLNIFEKVFEDHAEAMFLFSADDERIFKANHAANLLFSKQSIEGLHCADILRCQEEMEEKSPVLCYMLTNNNEPVEVRFSRLDNEKNLTLAWLVGSSNTEKEQILLWKNQQLTRNNIELDNFVYRVSHDLRAPIASCIGLTDLMQHEKNPDNFKYFNTLQQQKLKHLDKFVVDILNYSRNSRKPIEPLPVNFEEKLSEIAYQYSLIEDFAGTEFDYEVEQDRNFYTDSGRLDVILNNLISNAFKFINKYRTSNKVWVHVKTNKENAIVTVNDNGIGIHPDHTDKIFDMFHRATDVSKGSGLGLFIVKESLEKIEGKIEVKSVYGEGTSFKVELPNLKNKVKNGAKPD